MVADVFATRQFRAGNSQAVRIPAHMAFPPKTELNVHRQGNKIIIEPKEQTLEALASALAEWGKHYSGQRPQFEPEPRDCATASARSHRQIFCISKRGNCDQFNHMG